LTILARFLLGDQTNMEIINLDKFKAIKKVSIGGQVYEVYGITVGDYIDGTLQDKLAAGEGDTKEQLKHMVSALTGLTNIPVDVLKALPFKAITALLTIAQGSDPDDPEQEKASQEGNA
jgi:uncharacterized protein with GYD domain